MRFLSCLITLTCAVASISSAEACLAPAACNTANASGTAPACCCDNWSALTPARASQAVCMAANGYTTYATPSPRPPATCAEFNLLPDAGTCAASNSQCTEVSFNGVRCLCPAGQSWDRDHCTGTAPAALGTCPAGGVASPLHDCGIQKAAGACADSRLPIGTSPTVTSFAMLANPMAACCGYGWGEDPGPASKMDCIEAVAPVAPPAAFQSVLAFYLVQQGVAGVTAAQTGSVLHPNEFFMLDPTTGQPVNGFYTQAGVRCNFSPTLRADQQMTLYRSAITNARVPKVANGDAVDVPDACCNLVTFALERQCPKVDSPGGGTQVAKTVGGVRRCTAARSIKIDYILMDVCDATIFRRNRFRVGTTFSGDDPTKATIAVGQPIDLQSLIFENYPLLVPMQARTCPASGALFEIPWSGGMCRLKSQPPMPAPGDAYP